MKNIEITMTGDFIKNISKHKKDVEVLCQRALRKTAGEIDDHIFKTLTEKKLIDITRPDFRKTKTWIRKDNLKAGIDQMNVQMEVTATPHTSFRFWPKLFGSSSKSRWAGMIHGRRKLLYGGKAFSIPGKKPLFVRVYNNTRFPVKPVYGPNAVALLEQSEQIPLIHEFASRRLRENLDKLLKLNG